MAEDVGALTPVCPVCQHRQSRESTVDRLDGFQRRGLQLARDPLFMRMQADFGLPHAQQGDFNGTLEGRSKRAGARSAPLAVEMFARQDSLDALFSSASANGAGYGCSLRSLGPMAWRLPSRHASKRQSDACFSYAKDHA